MERQCVGVVVYLHIPIVLTDNFANAFQSETMLIAMGDTYSWTTISVVKGFVRQELMTVKTVNGVFPFLPALISINDSGMVSAAFTALSSRLQNNEVRSLSAMKSVVPLRMSA